MYWMSKCLARRSMLLSRYQQNCEKLSVKSKKGGKYSLLDFVAHRTVDHPLLITIRQKSRGYYLRRKNLMLIKFNPHFLRQIISYARYFIKPFIHRFLKKVF